MIVVADGDTLIDLTFAPPFAYVGAVGVIGDRVSSDHERPKATRTTAPASQIRLRMSYS